jgi:hypothetical protein
MTFGRCKGAPGPTYKQNAEAMDAFKKTLSSVWRKSARSAPCTPLEVLVLGLSLTEQAQFDTFLATHPGGGGFRRSCIVA